MLIQWTCTALKICDRNGRFTKNPPSASRSHAGVGTHKFIVFKQIYDRGSPLLTMFFIVVIAVHDLSHKVQLGEGQTADPQ